MATKTMTLAQGGSEDSGPWTHDEEVAVGTSDWVIVPRTAKSLTPAVLPVSSGSGYLEYTLDSEERIEAGTEYAQPWDHGEVSGYADDEIAPPTAFRLTTTAGTMRMAVKAVV